MTSPQQRGRRRGRSNTRRGNGQLSAAVVAYRAEREALRLQNAAKMRAVHAASQRAEARELLAQVERHGESADSATRELADLIRHLAA